MQAAFGTVLWVVCGVGAVVALVFLIQSGKTWDEYRDRGMVLDRDARPGRAPGPEASAAERDAEIREMLNARNHRRIRRGEAPIDVEVELARLTGRDVSPQAELAMAPQAPQTRNAAGGPGRFAAGETPNVGMDAGTGTDPALRAEIRQLVLARNHRRVRAGKPPLDVEAEIAREISDFGQGLR